MAERQYPIVLVHGYSDRGESFRVWRDRLCDRGYDVRDVSICNYQSLTNEVTIKDVAEGFDRALRTIAHLKENQPFSAIVHSTGMLVVRSWLVTSNVTERPRRLARLKHVIGLAPATFGSPLAHKGRSLLGSIFKGNRQKGPDFLEAGDLILDGLELASRFTWDLTHHDLLGERQFYGRGSDTPYVFVFCGTESYKGIRKLVNEPGTDGTVRWAGCALNTLKFTVDMTRDTLLTEIPEESRVTATNLAKKGTMAIPFWPIAGKNHGTIVSEPSPELISLVYKALQVDSQDAYEAWRAEARNETAPAMQQLEAAGELWQQFVVHATDERGDPIHDFHLELFTRRPDGSVNALDEFDFDVHAYGADKSFRCFHVNLARLIEVVAARQGEPLWVRIIASSGSALVGYHGVGSEKLRADLQEMDPEGIWDAQLELPGVMGDSEVSFFFPFTTTFIELKINRDPMPFGQIANKICEFLPD